MPQVWTVMVHFGFYSSVIYNSNKSGFLCSDVNFIQNTQRLVLIMILAVGFKQIIFFYAKEMSLSFSLMMTCLQNSYDCYFSVQFVSVVSQLTLLIHWTGSSKHLCVLKAFFPGLSHLCSCTSTTAHELCYIFTYFRSKVTLLYRILLQRQMYIPKLTLKPARREIRALKFSTINWE